MGLSTTEFRHIRFRAAHNLNWPLRAWTASARPGVLLNRQLIFFTTQAYGRSPQESLRGF